MRMNKVYYNELYDIYGSLLTKRQQEILQLYFQEDFSYAEISEELSISRAAVLDAVHKGCNALQKYEDCIHYIERGYECFEDKLAALGGYIEKIPVDDERAVQKFKLKVG